MSFGFDSNVATRDFLQLLTVQLRNQDPLDPVKQENFIAQLAQFSTLEGVENLNNSFRSMLRLQEISQGVELVGKTVDYIDASGSVIRTGRVDELFVDSGNIFMMVNGQMIPIEAVSGVKFA